MMSTYRRPVSRLALAGVMAGALALPAIAGGSVKDQPASEGRTWSRSMNIGVTSDYVFRGLSQRDEKPALQGGIDIGYGIFYAGAWASMIDFGLDSEWGGAFNRNVATTELDLYAGIKPTWGRLNFDFGVIYYMYPGARDKAPYVTLELDYVELKAGVSTSPFQNLTTGVTVFYSPEYTGKQGAVTSVEGAIAYELPKFGAFTPTIGGLLGASFGDVNDGFVAANGDDSYMYWNIGLSLGVDALTLDFRYWDTDISNAAGQTSCFSGGGPVFQCDERFVASAKVTF